MQLTALPVLQQDAAYYHYEGGPPNDSLWNMIDDIGTRLQRRTDGSTLHPDLLDPFVFAQFVSGVMGEYTVNGMPFSGNWRLLPAATRMADRLGCAPLRDALREAESELGRWDVATLNAFDDSTLSYTDQQDIETAEMLYERFDKRFWPLIEQAEPSYGHLSAQYSGGERLKAALCEWISEAMPRDVLTSREEVEARFRATHAWAWDHVENYGREFTKFHIGDEAYLMLDTLGLRFERTIERAFQPHELQVVPHRLSTTDGQEWIIFTFGDGKLLADAATLTEQTRHPNAVPLTRPDHLPKFLNMADRPKITLVDSPFITKRASLLKPWAKTLKYTLQ